MDFSDITEDIVDAKPTEDDNKIMVVFNVVIFEGEEGRVTLVVGTWLNLEERNLVVLTLVLSTAVELLNLLAKLVMVTLPMVNAVEDSFSVAKDVLERNGVTLELDVTLLVTSVVTLGVIKDVTLRYGVFDLRLAELNDTEMAEDNLDSSAVKLVWAVTLLIALDVTLAVNKGVTLVVSLNVKLRYGVGDLGLEVNATEVAENSLESSVVTLGWILDVTLLIALDVTLSVNKDVTLVVSLNVKLRYGVCNLGLEVNATEVAEDNLESSVVTLGWILEVTLLLALDVTLSVNKDVTLDISLNVKLRYGVCDLGLEVNATEVAEDNLESSVVTLGCILEVTLLIALDVTLSVNKDVTLGVNKDVTLDVFPLDCVCNFPLKLNATDVTEEDLKGNDLTLV